MVNKLKGPSIKLTIAGLVLLLISIGIIFGNRLFQSAEEDDRLAEAVSKAAKEPYLSPFPEDMSAGFSRTGDIWKSTGPTDGKRLIDLADRTDVKRLRLKYSVLKSSAYKRLQSEPLVTMEIEESVLSSKCLDEISKIETLKELTIRDQKIDDFKIGHLQGPKQLDILILKDSQITGEGLAHIVSSFPNLVTLGLQFNSKISDTEFGALTNLNHLEAIDLSNTAIGVQGVRALGQVNSLTSLCVENNPINDDVVANIKSKSLSKLFLANTFITDKSLERLEKMKGLKFITVFGCKGITTGGIERFRKHRPDVSLIDVYKPPVKQVSM